MSLTQNQIASRLRDMNWKVPGFKQPINIWGDRGYNLISKTKMTGLINEALIEWSMEFNIDKQKWTLDDGAGGEGTLTIDQRTYALPSDVLIVTEAYVAYDNDSEFRGYPLVIVDGRFLVPDPSDTAASTDRPERIFIWQDEFEVDPVPDAAYTLRFYGYHTPTSINANDDVPEALEMYHRGIFQKCKEVVAMELGVTNERQIVDQSDRVNMKAKRAGEKRHHAIQIVSGNTEYWD